MQTFTDIYRFRFILANLVSKNLKSMYRNMALGFVWSLLNPLILIVVLTMVWVVFFGAELTFPALVLVALIPFNFFSYCLSGCAVSIHGNASLIKKIAFPRQILPVSVIVTHLIHFGIQSTLVVAVLMLFPHPGDVLSSHLLWLPLIFVVQAGLCMGVGLLAAGLHVLYRDVQYIVDSTLTVLFWASPILYSAGPESDLAKLPGHFYRLYYLNPLSGILESYRDVLYFGRNPDPISLLMALGVTLIVGYSGVKAFWRHEREFADLI
ncbi:MAG: ABC transporter permease [Planctomycetota bacterium]